MSSSTQCFFYHHSHENEIWAIGETCEMDWTLESSKSGPYVRQHFKVGPMHGEHVYLAIFSERHGKWQVKKEPILQIEWLGVKRKFFPFYPHFLFRNWPVSAIAWLGLTTRHVGCWWNPLAPTCRTFIFLSFYFWVRTCWTIKDKPIPKVKLTRHLSHLCILHNRPIFIWIKFKDT